MRRLGAGEKVVATAAALALAASGGVVRPTHAGESDPPPPPFEQRREITLPERSLHFDVVDHTASCGAWEGADHAVDGDPTDWEGGPTWIAGTARTDAGELIWTDYPYDDDGTAGLTYPGEGEPLEARSDGVDRAGPLSQRYGANAADVVEIRFAVEDGFLVVLARMNFMTAVDAAVVGLAIDADGQDDPGTWPFGARVATPGADTFLTLHGTCAFLTVGGINTPVDLAGGAVATSTTHNVMELSVPLAALGLDGGTVRIAGGAGVWDPDTTSWMAPLPIRRTNRNLLDAVVGGRTPTDPAVFNLLFRHDEPLGDGGTPRTFQTTNQQTALRAGTTDPYSLGVDLDRLASRTATDTQLLRRGDDVDFTRVYRSKVLTEGVVATSGSTSMFLGRYQPYAVYLPPCIDDGSCTFPSTAPPSLLVLHGGAQDHTVFGHDAPADGGTALYGLNPFFAAVGDETGAIIARPLGRGQRSPWWRGLGEADVLEVMDDVHHIYGTDTERQVITGGSLGGYGTLRVASTHPGLWSGAIAHCPAAYENSVSERFGGNLAPDSQPFVVNDVMASMLHVPYVQASGTLDPLVPIVTNHRLRDTAVAESLDFRYTEYALGGHCYDTTHAALPWIEYHVAEYAELLSRPHTTVPARVRAAIDPRHDRPDAEMIGAHTAADLGLTPSAFYWVTGIELRPEITERAASGDTSSDLVGRLDVVSRALGGWETETASCGESTGLDANPALSPRKPTLHEFRCRAQTTAGSVEDRLDLGVTNIARLTVDRAAAGLAGRPFAIVAFGDGNTDLGLTGTPPTAITGLCVTGTRGGAVTLSLSSEPCTLEVTAS